MYEQFQRLYQRLDYTFQSPEHLKRALTHRSVGEKNNERYEFLGDSILNMVIAHALFERFPQLSEGELSRLRASLVKGDMLAEIALEIDLGHYLYLGQGELKSGGFRRASILADALEAIFAAIYLDGGFKASQQVILHLYHTRLVQTDPTDTMKDPKTALQEYLQAKKIALPEYTLTKVVGEKHEQQFYVSCAVPELSIVTTAHAETRRKAETIAATICLDNIRQMGSSGCES